GTLRVTVANTGIIDAENVKVAATTTNAGVTIGPAVSVGNMGAFTSRIVSFPVSMAATAPRGTNLAISVTVTGEQTCDPGGIVATLQAPAAVDEVANAATVDHVETQLTAWTPTGANASTLWRRIARPGANHVWAGRDAGFPSDVQLVSPVFQVGTTGSFVVKASPPFAFESSGGTAFDGGVIELSTDGGMTFADVTTFGVNPGYVARLARGGGNALEGRLAFAGRSANYPTLVPLTLDFGTQFAGKSVQL